MINKIKKILQSTSFYQSFLLEQHSKVVFWNGTSHDSTIRVKKLFNLWRIASWLKMEADFAYNLYEGGDFLDIGAFHGFYSALLSVKEDGNSKFISCEPDLKNGLILHKNIDTLRSSFQNIDFSYLPIAIGNGNYIRQIQPGGQTLHPQFGSFESQEDSNLGKTVKVDDLCTLMNIHPKFIKIDVEGAEMDVLEGMKNTLQIAKPILLIEIHPKWLTRNFTYLDIFDLLKSYNYDVKSVNDERISNDTIAFQVVCKPIRANE